MNPQHCEKRNVSQSLTGLMPNFQTILKYQASNKFNLKHILQKDKFIYLIKCNIYMHKI